MDYWPSYGQAMVNTGEGAQQPHEGNFGTQKFQMEDDVEGSNLSATLQSEIPSRLYE